MYDSHALVSYLVRERQRQGKSQRDIVRAVGVSLGSISEWERHLKDPSVSNMMKWAKALDCTLMIENHHYSKEKVL
jgi:transcriptional regulator with XRE-family HTH domain